MDNLSRRKFLGNAAKLALAGVVMPQILPSRVLGRQGVAPSGKINFGLIGNGLMMQLGEAAGETEILLDQETKETIRLKDLMPRWWYEKRMREND